MITPIWRIVALCMLAAAILLGCTRAPSENVMRVTVRADGEELTYGTTESVTVENFLSQAGFEYTPDDRIVPPLYTQITDGTRITIVRVQERETCEDEEIPYTVRTIENENFAPGERRIQRDGRDGLQRTCYRIIIQNGVEQERIPVGQPAVIEEPIDEIVFVGVNQTVEPFPVTGTLAYINNGNAWVVQRNSVEKRPLTVSGDLDGLVLALSDNGRYLLYTRESLDPDFINELWLIETRGQSSPVPLNITDVLAAHWVPRQPDIIAYSTGEKSDLPPGWRAYNNLIEQRVDLVSGRALMVRPVIPESRNDLYFWWGTGFAYSPQGQQIAWSKADGAGLYAADGTPEPLLTYSFFRVMQNWSWRASLSWSPDGRLLASTVHGDPIADEPPDTSPVFDIAIADAQGRYSATIVERTGMWASPQFSPTTTNPQLAYLQARDPENSIYGEYDLRIADRDGSNTRTIFPDDGMPGITWEHFAVVPQEYVWSPDGRSIAITYLGNIWVIDVESNAARRITVDGQSQFPVWSS